MTDLDLIRYVDAQAPIFESVVKELRAGRKTSHWMWFIFPQLTDLGRSSKAQYFGIQNLEQANVQCDAFREKVLKLFGKKKRSLDSIGFDWSD